MESKRKMKMPTRNDKMTTSNEKVSKNTMETLGALGWTCNIYF